jgi:hypothetical protein
MTLQLDTKSTKPIVDYLQHNKRGLGGRRQRALNERWTPDIEMIYNEDKSISYREYYSFKQPLDLWNSQTTIQQELEL